jgi:uncharacterized protein involved in exopolysaccharide biosynthesis
MKKKSKSKDFFESFDLLRYMYKRRYPLLVLTLLAVVASVIASLMITPRFRSTVVFFPAPSTAASRLLYLDSPFARDPDFFGDEEMVEQMLQVLNSDVIRSKIIEEYDLFNHYEIDPESKFPATSLHKKFRKNISFRKTEYMAVVIEVLDKEPAKAASMANDIAALLDSTMNRMQKEKTKKALEVVEKEYFNLLDEIRGLEDSLNYIRSKGVIAYDSQAEAYYQAYANALLKSDEEAVRLLEGKLKVISRYGGSYITLSHMLVNQLNSLSVLKAKYQEAQVNYNSEMPVKFILDNAYPAEKKAYPMRWLIVIVSTFSVFVLSFFLFLIMDTLRKKFR